MNKKTYKHLQETIFTEKLENGLTVRMIPKNEFKKTYAVLFTDFGSVDQAFALNGDEGTKVYPPGVAHFLEHCLFQTTEGDVSLKFSSQGATVNAFTNNTKTAYMCSFTSNAQENLETLIDFVQSPHFEYQDVEDEKQIISQEIQMYKDDPDWILTAGLIENMYPKHPLRFDVAGTLDSIELIDLNMLNSNYDAFYHPGNMHLIVIGHMQPLETMQWIKNNQLKKKFTPHVPTVRQPIEEDVKDIIKYRESQFPVSMSKVLVGVKGDNFDLEETAAFRHIVLMEIVMDLLLSETASTYLDLYNKDLIDDSFSYDYMFERSFDYVSIGGDTRYPDELAAEIKNVLLMSQSNPDMTLEHFDLVKKKMLGHYIQGLNSLESTAHQFVDFSYDQMTLFDSISVLETVTFEEVKETADNYFKEEFFSVFVLKPENE